jgi:phosphoglycolate phosphatase-like HAD superfamily hydrolase
MHKHSIIFDVEGTLVDSVPFTLRSWQEVLAETGKPRPLSALQELSGMDGRDMLATLLPEVSPGERSVLLELHGRRFERDYLMHIQPFPHVRDVLQDIAGTGVTLALATDCKGRALRRYRGILGIDHVIGAVACGDDVDEGKPNPGVIAIALQKLDNPHTAIMVGDTPSDARAASNEGIRCIGVLTGCFGAEVLDAAGCIATVPDIVALPRALPRFVPGMRRS